MDSSAFNRMDFGGIWWLFFWAAIGILASVLGIGNRGIWMETELKPEAGK